MPCLNPKKHLSGIAYVTKGIRFLFFYILTVQVIYTTLCYNSLLESVSAVVVVLAL